MKQYVSGTHRARHPTETVADFGRHMRAFGITRLANVTGLDVIGVPVVMAVRPNARGLSVSQGKGLDLDAARASALMESIETWHAERVTRPLRWESYEALRSMASVVDVEDVPRRRGVPPRLDLPMLWVEGHDLLTDDACWMPFDTVSTNFVLRGDTISPFFMSSNGLASGNCQAEAIVHGLCEVIERDALTLWHLEGREQSKARQVDPDTVDDPHCRELLLRLARADVGVGLWDITSDLRIPAFATAIFDRRERPRWQPMGMFSGYGCHPSPAVALARALCEAVQSRLTMIAGTRDDLLPRDYLSCSNADDYAQLTRRIVEPPPCRAFADTESMATATFEGDLDVLLDAVRGAGLERVVVADLSQPEFAIPVVKVLVPGLEGIVLASSYVPGRRANARLARTAYAGSAS